jgi:hypothetical protein
MRAMLDLAGNIEILGPDVAMLEQFNSFSYHS